LIPSTFEHKDLRKHVGRPLVDAFSELLIRRSRQPLFLLRAVVNGAASSDDEIAEWLSRSLIAPVETTIQRIAAESASSDEELGVEECNRLELAEQEAGFLLDECRSIDLVGRYDGMNTAEREAHRRNFNDFYNPFVLLVSRVGEEGIDLQKQCRYVVHYDLEWNPAKMEQREGRVDRVGWGRTNEEFIDVRFMLLKATYEERIFHTVMQRDQWFQILIGSKRRELGELDADEAADEEDAEKSIEETAERGRLTEDEKRKVMLDLRPAGGG
jgi:ERCC4-related helicase